MLTGLLRRAGVHVRYMHAAETPGEGLKWAPLQLSATVVKGEAGARTITISYDLNRTAIRTFAHRPARATRRVAGVSAITGRGRKTQPLD